MRAAAEHWASSNGVVVQVDRCCEAIGPSQTMRVATCPLCCGKDMPDLLPSTAYFFPGIIAEPDRDQVAARESLAEAEISYSARDRQALFTVIFYGLPTFSCKTAQLCATAPQIRFPLVSFEKHAAQRPEKLRKNSALN